MTGSAAPLVQHISLALGYAVAGCTAVTVVRKDKYSVADYVNVYFLDIPSHVVKIFELRLRMWASQSPTIANRDLSTRWRQRTRARNAIEG